MARRRLGEARPLSPRNDHWFIGRPIDKTAQSERAFKIYGFEEERFGRSRTTYDARKRSRRGAA